LPGEKAGKRIGHRKWREDEESVGGNALQHIDALMLVATAKLELMPAMHPGQRSGVVKNIFVRVARPGDWVADRRIAVHLDKRRPHGNIEAGRVLKTKSGRCLVVFMLAKEELVTQERESRDGDQVRREGVCLLRDKVLRALIFAHGKARNASPARREGIDLRELVEHVAKIERVARIEIVIHLDAELVAVIAQSLRGGKEIRPRVGKREEAQQVFGDGVDLVAGNLIVRVGSVRENVEELVRRIVAEAGSEALGAKLGEVAATLRHRRHGGQRGLALPVAEALVVPEIEGLVLPDRTAHGCTKLVLLQWLLHLGEIVVSIDGIVAQELPHRTVDMVGARARDDVRRRAQRAPEFGIRVERENAKFGNRIDGWLQNESSIYAIEVIRAVDEEVVRLRALAVHGVSLSAAQRAAGFGNAGRKGNHAWLQKPEL